MSKEVDKKKKKKVQKKEVKKADYVVLTTLGLFILFLVGVLIYLNNGYFKSKDFMVDYLSLTAKNYVAKEGNSKVISSEDGACKITIATKITKNKNLKELGESEKINNHEWVKQEYENGVTWMSYYKNSFYIVQMYAKNGNIYNNKCKKQFEKIRKTFSFIQSE